MILHHQKLEYQGKVLIEKVRFKAPYRHQAFFQNEGCFIYAKGNSAALFSSKEKVTIDSHDSVLLKCGTYFVDFLENIQADETDIYAIHLYPEVLKTIYEREMPSFIVTQPSGESVKKIVSNEIVSQFIDSIHFYFDNPTVVNDALLEIKIKELVLILIQTKNADSILTLISELFSPKSVTLHEVVQGHLFSNLSTAELAQLSGMSLSTFKREFKKVFDATPTNYFNARKLKRAEELLKMSSMSASQIAYEVGFSDPAYFSRLFKKVKNQTPLQYREKE